MGRSNNGKRKHFTNFDKEGQKKLTWSTFFKDFKRFYPELAESVYRWEPYDYFNMIIYFKNGNKGLYNIDSHEFMVLNKEMVG